MRISHLLTLFAAFVLFSVSAYADAITPDGSWHEFGFGLAGTAAISCGGCIPTTNPVAEQTSSPPWTFSGAAILTLLDLFNQGDRFQIFDFGVSIGVTSIVPDSGTDPCGGDIGCALADVGYSRLIANLGGGNHSLTINVIQNAGNTLGGAATFRVAAAQVPEPGTLALLGSGIVSLAFWRRRQRRC